MFPLYSNKLFVRNNMKRNLLCYTEILPVMEFLGFVGPIFAENSLRRKLSCTSQTNRLTVRRTVEFAGKLARIRPRKQWWPPIGHTIFFLPIIDKHLNESRNWFVKSRLVIAISPVLESFRCHFPQPNRPWVYEDGHDSVFFSFTSNFFANVKVHFE